MYLTQLAKVARRTVRPVVEVPGWKTRGHGPMTNVETITCHHTAGPRSGNAPSLKTVLHGRPGLAGPLAHYVLGRDGTIYVVAAGVCWHAGVSRAQSFTNSHAVGIEAEATGVDEWPAVQTAAYAALAAELCKEFRLPVGRVLGHKETCAPVGRKVDPNLAMPALRSAAAAYLTPKPKPSKPKPLEDPMPLLTRTSWDGKHPLKTATWVTIPATASGNPSVLIGATGGQFNADIGVTLQLKPGSQFQVKPYVAVPDGKGGFQFGRSFYIRESTATTGATYWRGFVVGQLAANERLRIQVATFDDPQGGLLTHADASIHYWRP